MSSLRPHSLAVAQFFTAFLSGRRSAAAVAVAISAMSSSLRSTGEHVGASPAAIRRPWIILPVKLSTCLIADLKADKIHLILGKSPVFRRPSPTNLQGANLRAARDNVLFAFGDGNGAWTCSRTNIAHEHRARINKVFPFGGSNGGARVPTCSRTNIAHEMSCANTAVVGCLLRRP